MFAGIQTFLNALVDIPPDDDGADILFLIELMETNPVELVPLFLQIIYFDEVIFNGFGSLEMLQLF